MFQIGYVAFSFGTRPKEIYRKLVVANANLIIPKYHERIVLVVSHFVQHMLLFAFIPDNRAPSTNKNEPAAYVNEDCGKMIQAGVLKYS